MIWAKRAIVSCLVLILSLSPTLPRLGSVPGAAQAAAAGPAIHLEPFLSGLSSPIYLTSARDGSNRLFVVEQAGVIKVVQPGSTAPTVFLDIRGTVLSGGEQGLLGLAFHPQFASNRRFFVDYTRRPDGATVIAEYQASVADPDVAGAAETVLLTIAQPFSNHNGGMIGFGADGFLYIGVGDGGSGNDPGDRAQDLDELLGKILRIDVDNPDPDDPSIPYSSPSTNPFIGVGRAEIFAYGLRNPWRFSFDRLTGDLVAGDVGQSAREEIDLVTIGGNYGWRVREGGTCTNNDPGLCDAPGFTPPLVDYAHSGGRCSVTGGYVYRGTLGSVPAGTYVFGDFCTGEIFQREGAGMSLLLDTGLNISSFGEDEAGEIYVVNLGGTIDRIATGGVGCTFALGSTGKSFPPRARSGRVSVSAPAACTWSAASNASWISLTSGASGAGSGAVRYAVASNADDPNPRTGTLTIAGRTFTVTQAGSPSACRASISPTTKSFSPSGGTGAVAVTIGASCGWTAVSNAGWISITAGSSGTGNGTVSYSAAPGSGIRRGTVTIAGRTFRVVSH